MESFRFNYKTAFIALNGELFLPDIKYSFRSSTSKNQDFQENLRRIGPICLVIEGLGGCDLRYVVIL